MTALKTLLFGEALLFEATVLLGYTLAVFVGFHLIVLLYEEPALRRQFGDAYRTYCKAVPRWFPRRWLFYSKEKAVPRK